MKILGIDPGTAIVGWGIIEKTDSGIKTISYGHISTNPQQETAERLHEIRTDLQAIITQYQPDEAAVENLFFFKNQKTIITVAQARGVILEVLYANGIQPAEYTPLQVKQALTSYGRADKKQMQQMVQNVLALKEVPQPDDTADALAVALCHGNSHAYQQTLTQNT